MTDRRASSTAASVAWFHAAHQVLDSEPRILDDPVICRLMEVTPAGIIQLSERFQAPWARALRAHVVTRTRFAEDALASAATLGVRQYVILGAGMDTFAYRQPAWAHDVRVFEVDQPGTQATKRQRVAAAGIPVPENVSYVAIDFESESLADGLRRGGVRLNESAFFAWLGVTMYLTEPAIDAVLGTVAALARPSEIVFTFAQPRTADDDTGGGPSLADLAAASGEPWVTYFEPEALERKLRGLGFGTIRFLTPPEAEVRYFRGRLDGLPAPRRTTIVSAAV